MSEQKIHLAGRQERPVHAADALSVHAHDTTRGPVPGEFGDRGGQSADERAPAAAAVRADERKSRLAEDAAAHRPPE